MDLIRIAKLVRKTRKQQGLTVEALANKTGMSKAFISRLENFRLTPSLRSLSSIADALGINMANFFLDKSEQVPFLIGSLQEGEPVEREGASFGMTYFSLAYGKPDRAIDPFIIEYRPGDEDRDFTSHSAEEFFVLLEGQVEFYFYDNQTPHHLVEGQTAYLSRDLPHRVLLSEGCTYARALVIYQGQPQPEES